MPNEQTKLVRFLQTETVHRAGEHQMIYLVGKVYALRVDRANLRIANGMAVEVKGDDKVDNSETVAGKDGGNTGIGAVDVGAGGRKGPIK